MSRKITRYCSLKERDGKEVYAYFKWNKGEIKVRCKVSYDTDECLWLIPTNEEEEEKLRSVKGRWWVRFLVPPAWPNTKENNSHLLIACSAVGHNINRKSKTIEDITVYSQDGLSVNCDEVYNTSFEITYKESGYVQTGKGPWKIVYDPKETGLYLLHNDPDGPDGGQPAKSLMEGYSYSWWLKDAEDSNPLYSLKIGAAVEEPAKTATIGVKVGSKEDTLERIATALESIAKSLQR